MAGDVEQALRRACKGYVLGVKSDHHFGSWGNKPPVAGTAEEIARDLAPGAGQRLSAGEGTQGPRLPDWAYCELADLDADEYDETKSGLWTRGLLIRRTISDGDLAFFTTGCPTGTGIQTLVAVEGHRWAEPAKKVPRAQHVEGRRRGSKTASRPQRMNSASTTTKPGPGMAGTATSRSSCSPSL